MNTYDWTVKRKTPYTKRGIKQVACAKCGEQAVSQWNICADHNYHRPLCDRCDVFLNALVLAWFRHPSGRRLVEDYAISKMVDLNTILPNLDDISL